eukprot:965198-Pyramimonas_sp.AAC.1
MASRTCYACYALDDRGAHWPRSGTNPCAQGPPLRTPYGVEKVPCLLCPGRAGRIAPALRDHPLRTPL